MTRKRKVLFVGWDAADWKVINPLLDRNELPVLASVIERGVIGDLATLSPVLSPMLWTSISTGKYADQHGILGFTEVDRVSGRVRPTTSTSRRTKALWNILSQNGYRTDVAGWFASHPAEPVTGVCISDAFARALPGLGEPWPLLAGTVFPPTLEPELRDLRLRPDEIDPEIFRLFVPSLDQIDQSRPNGLDMLSRVLSECFTTHAAATWLMENTEWDFMAAYYIGLDHFGHGFMNYHPPRLAWVDPLDYEIYKDVVSAGYRLMDLFLGRLLQLAGPEATVIVMSDHGFKSDHLRPRHIPEVPAGPAAQHRSLGVFALAGEGIRQDERLYGANLLDVAPTILSLFGLPAGEDMPGRVLVEAFESLPCLSRIPSWDLVEGESGMHPAGTSARQDETVAEQALMKQFVALGYIDPQSPDGAEAAAICERERSWNLARVYTSTRRFAQALPLLEQLHAEVPDREDFLLALANVQLRLSLHDEASASAAALIRGDSRSPLAHMVLGRIAFEKRRYRESLDHLLSAEQAVANSPELQTRLGFVYVKLRRWDEAHRAFCGALENDPHSALAHQGLARVFLRKGKPQESASAAFDSIACRHDLPLTHFLLGLALLRLGKRDRAIEALETSLSFNTRFGMAHRVLAILYGETREGLRHRAEARRFSANLARDKEQLEAIREQIRERKTARDDSARREPENLTFTVVSGLPRSGTSLMMRMLESAGMPLMTDGVRIADPDNPDGYFEWEEIKRIGAEPDVITRAAGKVIKVISMLIPSLPARYKYKVLFMDRPVSEIAISQAKMISHRHGKDRESPIEEMENMLKAHRDRILKGLQTAPGFEVLVIDYPSLVQCPEKWLPRIQDFIGPMPHPEAMREVIRPALHRNRS